MIPVTFNGYHETEIDPVDPALVVATGGAVKSGRRCWVQPATLPTGEKCVKVFNSEDCTDESCTSVIVDVSAE